MLKPAARVIDRGDRLVVADGQQVVTLTGDLHALRRVLLAAPTDPPVEDTVTAADGVAETDLIAARDLLRRLGLWVDSALPLPATLGYVLGVGSHRTTPEQATARLDATTVHLWGRTHTLAATLRATGVRVTEVASAADLAALDPRRAIVVVVDDDLEPTLRLADADAACRANGLPWLPVHTYDGGQLRIGPLIVPGHTACLQCYYLRAAANVGHTEDYDALAHAPAVEPPRPLSAWRDGLLALLLVRWICTDDADVAGKVFTLDPANLDLRAAAVLPVPRCPSCRSPEFLDAIAPWAPERDE